MFSNKISSRNFLYIRATIFMSPGVTFYILTQPQFLRLQHVTLFRSDPETVTQHCLSFQYFSMNVFNICRRGFGANSIPQAIMPRVHLNFRCESWFCHPKYVRIAILLALDVCIESGLTIIFHGLMNMCALLAAKRKTESNRKTLSILLNAE